MAGILYLNMFFTSSAIFFLVYVSGLQCHDLRVSEGILKEPVTLACTCSENTSVVEWSIFHPVNAVIIKYQNGEWETQKGFQGRFKMLKDHRGGNFSMTINPTFFNDAGIYKCICDRKTCEVRLRVFVPLEILAREGENVSLPCYGDTRLHKDVTWKKDGQTVLQYTHEDKDVTPDDYASRGRFMLSKKGLLDGDLSLQILFFNQSDAGLYLCLTHDESRAGEPPAVRLHVLVNEEDQQSTTTDYCWKILAGLASILALAILGLIILCVYSRVKESQPVTPRSRCPVQEETPPVIKHSSIQPFLGGQ